MPVWFQRGKNAIELDWLPADGNLFLEKGEEPLLVINADSYAIARINYEESGWQKIFEQLELDSTVGILLIPELISVLGLFPQNKV